MIGWLCRASKDLFGHGEAYCKLCRVALRAQKHDLKKHSATKIHKEKASAFNLTKQKCLMDSGKQFKIIIYLLYTLVNNVSLVYY